MKVYENLLFQKKYFPYIFEGYKKNAEAELEVSATAVGEGSVEIKDEILCICESFQRILKEVFHVPEELNEKIQAEIEEYSSIVIYDSCEEKVECFPSQGVLELYFTLPYIMNNFKIRLEKKPNRKSINKAAKIIAVKELDFFEAMSFKGSEYHRGLKDLKELKKFFLKLECFYKEKDLYNNLSKQKQNDDTSETFIFNENQNTIISMEICKDISRSISEKRFDLKDLSYIINTCMKEFTEKAVDFLKTVIIEPNFSRNYAVVENYLEISKNLELKLKDFLETTAYKDISKLLNSSNHTDLFLQLLKSKLVLIDSIIGESLEIVHTKVSKG
jgi:hypothetical protein